MLFYRVFFWALVAAIAVLVAGVVCRLLGWPWFFTPLRDLPRMW